MADPVVHKEFENEAEVLMLATMKAGLGERIPGEQGKEKDEE